MAWVRKILIKRTVSERLSVKPFPAMKPLKIAKLNISLIPGRQSRS